MATNETEQAEAMSVAPPWIENISNKIVKARELSESESKNDPESNPYKSKYEARKIIKDLLADAEEEINSTELGGAVNPEDDGKVEESEAMKMPIIPTILLAAIEYEVAVNYIETEEISTGEEHLQSCLNYLKGTESTHPLCVSLLIAAKCQYGMLWSSRADHEKSLKFFQEAENLHSQYKEIVGNSPLFYRDILLGGEERHATTTQEREAEFEKQHTLTLYYMAQSYNNLGEREKSGKYCHITLIRQMETSQYEPQDWALNCATLAQFYITKDMYNFSRYCLACASCVGEEAILKFNPEDFDENERQRAEDKVNKMKADIARCWAKYCLNLLISSHEKKLQDIQSAAGQTTQEEQNTDPMSDDDLKHLKFKGLEVTSLEEGVTDKLVDNYDEAKQVFLSGQKWLQQAKEFYVLDGYVSDSIEIDQDLSQLYKYLAFFDDSFERRCKMHKRRIDLLNAPLLELNPQHFLQICRQLTFEIGDTYADMADLKKAIMEQDTTRVSVESIKKYNKLLLQGIKFYEGFVDSYRQMNKQPEKYEDDAVRGVLLAYFYMARLHSKYLTPEKSIKGEHLLKEKELYDFILNYCDSHPDMPKVFEEELSVTREMVALFPAKMNQVLDR
eukprot:Seg1494.6 transcript_id=Seg1494.6/GoldUCD/mRNA.D3Y31 product="KIF1-binding protein-like" protein_id=Seg1494.6/GoldUCD/D3Y31